MKSKISKAIIYFVLICFSYIYLYPILEMISKSFMSAKDVIDPSITWIPKHPSINNFKVAAGVLNLKKTFIGSLWFSGVMALAQTIVSAMTGFAMSRYNFRFKNVWLVLILVAFIIPTTLLVIPRLMLFMTAQNTTGIQLIGTPIPQLLMALLGQGVNGTILILIFYNFFNLIPYSLDEAAMIDGAGPLQVFFHVAVKLSLSTVLVVFLFAFVWNWNETYVTGTFVRSSIALLPQRLNMFDSVFATYASSGGAGGGEMKLNEAYKMAGTFISILPLLVLYGFVQKQFIQGIENTGITGE
ncbi:MAG: carbohydrate ABC transporter permease [Lachnospiraceae bacterium]|nr:carbohydrate ABC transporter permease [Lachnospiraceae bacterium]